MLAFGVRTYFVSYFNCADFGLIIIWAVDAALELLGSPSHKYIKIVRFLRPLRLCNRVKLLRDLVIALKHTATPAIRTLLTALASFAVIGIVAVQLFEGRMNFCSDSLVFHKAQCVGVDEATGHERVWLLHSIHYDWIGQATLAILYLATKDSWARVMWAAVDATGTETGPYQNHSLGVVFFFLFIVIFGSFFVLTIVAGIFVDSYKSVVTVFKRRLRRRLSIMSSVGDRDEEPPFEPLNISRFKVFTAITCSNEFDIFILAMIVANVITLTLESYQNHQLQQDFVDTANFFFTFLFGMEAIIKLYALHPTQYFAQIWNCFDFLISMASFFSIIFEFQTRILSTNWGIGPGIIRALRLLRLVRQLRAFRLFKSAAGLRGIGKTLLQSLVSFRNLIIIMVIAYVGFGVLLVELFGGMCVEDRALHWELGEAKALETGKLDRCLLVSPRDYLDRYDFASLLSKTCHTTGMISRHSFPLQACAICMVNVRCGPLWRNWGDLFHTMISPAYMPVRSIIPKAQHF